MKTKITNNLKVTRKTKTILILEGIFIIGVLAYLLASKPVAIAPISGNVINEGDFNFKFENAKKVIISRDKEFESKIEFKKEFAINLPPGTYYWKVKGWIRESQIMNFTIANKVSLRIDEQNNTLSVYNVGTKDIKIKVLDGEKIFLENKTLLSGHYIKENISGKIIIEGEQK
ncbi:MAG: hypothetical protein AABW73_00980 [Nanoarchaeota archaeon]